MPISLAVGKQPLRLAKAVRLMARREKSAFRTRCKNDAGF
jgi:hypothetical protein